MTSDDRAVFAAMFAPVACRTAALQVQFGRPTEAGWIAGESLLDACGGPLHELLERIGHRVGTGDRRTIAASFALRFGWASALAIAPFLRDECVPDVALDNIAFKFKPSTFFESTALYVPRGVVTDVHPRAAAECMRTVPDREALLAVLRRTLIGQAQPVVEALHRWSGFARRGTWGLLTSSWAAQFTAFSANPDDQRAVQPVVERFFAGDDVVAVMQPRLHAVSVRTVTHLYQRRASCCRYYLLPQGDLCASCPLVPDQERVARNREWMEAQLGRRHESTGHA